MKAWKPERVDEQPPSIECPRMGAPSLFEAERLRRRVLVPSTERSYLAPRVTSQVAISAEA